VSKQPNRGIFNKFKVERTDGRSAPGEKHHGCAYFVLDLRHDPYAWPAIDAYAKACKDEYPELASDLLRSRVLGEIRPLRVELPNERDPRASR
jgi:hypothetical protein